MQSQECNVRHSSILVRSGSERNQGTTPTGLVASSPYQRFSNHNRIAAKFVSILAATPQRHQRANPTVMQNTLAFNAIETPNMQKPLAYKRGVNPWHSWQRSHIPKIPGLPPVSIHSSRLQHVTWIGRKWFSDGNHPKSDPGLFGSNYR